MTVTILKWLISRFREWDHWLLTSKRDPWMFVYLYRIYRNYFKVFLPKFHRQQWDHMILRCKHVLSFQKKEAWLQGWPRGRQPALTFWAKGQNPCNTHRTEGGAASSSWRAKHQAMEHQFQAWKPNRTCPVSFWIWISHPFIHSISPFWNGHVCLMPAPPSHHLFSSFTGDRE